MVYTKHHTVKKISHLANATDYIENAIKTIVEPGQVNMSHLDNLFPYVMNDDKTMSKQLVSGYHIIDVENAEEEFLQTKEIFSKSDKAIYEFDSKTGKVVFQKANLEKNNAVLAHHLIQSFSPEDELTPEEVHEIGRQTVLELTGGEHEFIIATHIDKGHLHNHIIFNSTNLITGKAFRWQKNTKQRFEDISDKIAVKHGAKIIDKTFQNSHSKYTMYQTNNIYKSKIKQRLDHLLKYSNAQNFMANAKMLGLEINVEGKWTKFKLTDEPQEKWTRSRALNKSNPEKYNFDNLQKRLAENDDIEVPIEDIVSSYEEKINRDKVSYDWQFKIRKNDIDHQTARGIYLKIDYGIAKHGLVFIPGFKLDEIASGDFTAFLKISDRFYFVDDDPLAKGKYMSASELMNQLRQKNGNIPIKNHREFETIHDIVDQINFYLDHGISNHREFKRVFAETKEKIGQAQRTMVKLDRRIMRLETEIKKVMSGTAESTMSLSELKTQLSAYQQERRGLSDSLNHLIDDFDRMNDHYMMVNGFSEEQESRKQEETKDNTIHL
jgi:hypothetical protein